MDIKDYFETYITTYIERDIRQLINVQDELKFYKFISNIAVRTGQELNMTDICNEIGISNVTGDSWLSILTNTNQGMNAKNTCIIIEIIMVKK